MILAGQLNQLVQIQKPVTGSAAENSYGELDTTVDAGWQRVDDRWAEVLTQGSREVFRTQQFQPDVTHLVRMRYDTTTKDVTPEMRLILKDRDLQILSANNMDEANELMELVCREKK